MTGETRSRVNAGFRTRAKAQESAPKHQNIAPAFRLLGNVGVRLLFVRLGVAGFFVSSLVACGGDDFESTKGGSGGTSTGGADGGGTGGTSTGGVSGGGGSGALGGGAGVAGTGALGGTAGSAGSGGGTPCTDETCGDDEYCHDQSGECRKCTDPDEFTFFPPQPLTVINAAHPDKDLHAPRQFETGAPAIIYSVGYSVYDRELWATENYTQTAGFPFPPPVDIQPSAESSGLVILPPTDGPLAPFALLYDHHEQGTFDLDLYGSEYDPVGMVFKDPIKLPAPFNSAGWDWAPAYSQVAQRMWWISNRDLGTKLYTASTALGAPAIADVVPLTTFSPSCPITDGDLGPWVAPGGYLILFHGQEKFAACAGSKSDIYVAALKPDGTALPAFPLDVNLQNTQDEWPSMSFDMCTLYFSSQRDGASHTQLYTARRK